jgi:hypothetical protein
MKLNLYVSEENVPLVDRAKKEMGDDSLSTMFIQCLKARLPSDVPSGDLETIVMQHGTLKKRFQGRYIFGSSESTLEFDGGMYTVARSKQDRLVVEYSGSAHPNAIDDESTVNVYENFAEMAEAEDLPSSLKAAVAEELGLEYIEDLDI